MKGFGTGRPHPDPARFKKIKRGEDENFPILAPFTFYFYFYFLFLIFLYLLFNFYHIKINIFHKK